MIGNLLSDQPAVTRRTSSMVPPGMGELNYLQSLIASITNQELNTTSSPAFVGLTLSGLTASVPIVTDANKALASVTYAAFKSSLAIAQADVSGLTTASSPTFAGMTLTGLSGYVKATAGVLSAGAIAAGDLPAHVLDGAVHSVSGLTGGHFLKATGATTFGFAAHGLTYSDVGAEASGAVATHAALITGVHGLVFTAGKTLTLQKSMTFTAADDTGVYTFPTGTKTLLATDGSPASLVIASQATGDILYASSATAWARLPIGAAGKALVVNAGGTLPEWGTVLTNPMDDAGQLIYGGVAGAPTKLAAGATTTILVGGGAGAPVWTTATGTGAPVRKISPTFTDLIDVYSSSYNGVCRLSGTTLGDRTIAGTLEFFNWRTESNLVIAQIKALRGLGDYKAGQLGFFTSAASTGTLAERMTINEAGNVGIGTTAPISLLHVNAADTVTGVLTIGGGKNTVTAVGEINAQLDFRSNDGSVNNTNQIGGRIASVTELNSGAYTGLAFYTFTQGGSPDLKEAIRITRDGNLLLKTTNTFVGNLGTGHANNGSVSWEFGSKPDGSNLTGMKINQVWDGTYNDESIAFHTHDGGVSAGARVTIDKSGRVVIGSVASGAQLSVSTATAATDIDITTSSTSYAEMSLRFGYGCGSFYGHRIVGANTPTSTYSGTLYFQYGNGSSFVTTMSMNEGWVGIGVTPAANYRLKIKGVGTSTYAGIWVTNSGDADCFVAYDNGNIWCAANCSALSFTDRTQGPKDAKHAYDMLASVKFVDEKGDYSVLHSDLKIDGPVGVRGRNLTLLVSSLAAVVNDLTGRIKTLESTK